jgi:predicted DNA-binding protein (UPF0251 family)
LEHDLESQQRNGALDALTHAYELAKRAVEDEPDALRAFEAATVLTEAVRRTTIQLGQLRALQAARVRDQESLSLGALADRLQVSKARAQQFVESAEKTRASRNPPAAAGHASRNLAPRTLKTVDDAVRAKIDAAVEAGHTALTAINSMPDSKARIEAAGKLVDCLRSVYEDAARIRRAEVVRIYETEDLSLAQLADRVGISKARVDQIVRAYRKGAGLR